MRLIDESVRYTTPIIQIGKHEWAMQVYELGGRCHTRYRWRRLGASDTAWQDERDWPRYDPHDTHDGFPRTLCRHYYRHQAAIEHALGRSGQATLFE